VVDDRAWCVNSLWCVSSRGERRR